MIGMMLVQPLNLQNLLVNTLAGSINIFIFLAMVALSAGAAFFKMPNLVFGMMLGIFVVMLSNFLGGIYLIVLLISGFLIFNAIANMFR